MKKVSQADYLRFLAAKHQAGPVDRVNSKEINLYRGNPPKGPRRKIRTHYIGRREIARAYYVTGKPPIYMISGPLPPKKRR